MKFQVSIFIFIFIFLACKKDNEILPSSSEEEILTSDSTNFEENKIQFSDFEIDKKEICNSVGKLPSIPILNLEDQLLKIEQISPNRTYKDSFIYNQANRLVSIDQLHLNGRIFEFEWNNDSLIQFMTFDKHSEKRLIFRDSLGYGSDGRLLNNYNFSINAGPSIPLSIIDSFFYDSLGYLTHHSSYSLTYEKYYEHNIFCWEDGNLVHNKSYDDEGKLKSETLKSFSAEKELKVAQLIPTNWLKPLLWGTKKVLDSQFIDHAGTIDFVCNPCYTDFTYDEKGRLILAEGEYGRLMYTYRD